MVALGIVGARETYAAHHIDHKHVSNHSHHSSGCGGSESKRAYFGLVGRQQAYVGKTCQGLPGVPVITITGISS